MRCVFFFTFLLLCIAASAQKRKVSDICAQKKLVYDSAMRVEYGGLFPYFMLDSSSSGLRLITETRFYPWNDSTTGVPFAGMSVKYNFHFPGARKDLRFYTRIPDADGNLLPDTVPFCTSETIISSAQMDRIARRKLRVPLSECIVRPFFGDDWMDRSHRAHNNYKHAFLYVLHTREKAAPFGGCNRVHRSFVVDATTGKAVGRMVRTKGMVCYGKWE